MSDKVTAPFNNTVFEVYSSIFVDLNLKFDRKCLDLVFDLLREGEEVSREKMHVKLEIDNSKENYDKYIRDKKKEEKLKKLTDNSVCLPSNCSGESKGGESINSMKGKSSDDIHCQKNEDTKELGNDEKLLDSLNISIKHPIFKIEDLKPNEIKSFTSYQENTETGNITTNSESKGESKSQVVTESHTGAGNIGKCESSKSRKSLNRIVSLKTYENYQHINYK